MLDKKLPKKFKKLWVKALKSGDFAQGSGALCTIKENQSKTYCCLGVACSVAGVSDELLYGGDYIQKVHYKQSKKQGTKIPKMLVGDNDLTALLAQMNDEDHKSFRKIAKWIKKTL